MSKITSWLKVVGILLLTRALPALTLAILFGVVAVQVDRWHVQNQPASDFIKYTAFDVQNSRANEDVYFKVCRGHKENYTYAGALTVYIYRDVDPKGTQTKVYAKDIGGSIRTDCENKVLRASDFAHTAGTYKMAFCIDFRVKYDIQKTACKESNIYKIYPQPADINAQLQYYQQQIEMLQRQRDDAKVNNPSSLEAPRTVVPNSGTATTPSTNGSPAASPPAVQGGSSGGATPQPTARQTCTVPLLFGSGLLCGSDGLLRL